MYRLKVNRYVQMCALFLYLGASTGVALAQQNVNNARGFKADSYQNGMVDDINLYNGNLTLSIPLGKSYKIGGGLDFQLTLVYNSNVWEIRPEFDRFADNGPAQVDRSVPDKRFNAGIGWVLTLGNLYPPNIADFNPTTLPDDWLYVSVDGAEHRFYPTLHDGENPDPNGKFFTRDGSFLRLTRSTPQGPKLEFPDGSVQTFENNYPYRVRKIEDKRGNKLEVDYSTPYEWHLNETNAASGVLRSHIVEFQQYGEEIRVKFVRMAAFGGGRAAYQFKYLDELSGNATTIGRHYKDRYNWERNEQPRNPSVSLLSQIMLPEGAGSYSFEYGTDYVDRNSATMPEMPGAMKKAVLPTGGRYEWTYRRYGFRVEGAPPNTVPYPDDAYDERWETTEGVMEKKIFDRGGTYLGSFTYNQELVNVRDGNQNITEAYSKNKVVGPDGNLTVHYFANMPQRWDYGLPYSRHKASGGMFVSKEYYQGDAENSSKLLRSSYVRYQSDSSDAVTFPFDHRRDFNKRLTKERTLYHDDGNRYADVFYEQWDGLRHEVVTTGGNFAKSNVRTVTTDYTPRPGSNQAWFLNLYTSQTATDETGTATVQYHFDTTKGELLRKRVLKGAGMQGQDVVTEYTYDSDGSLSSESYFGGDRAGGVPSGDLAAISLTSPEYVIDHTNIYGQRATSKFVGKAFFTLDQDIDMNSGLVISSRDSSKMQTNYQYDGLGRMTQSQTGNDALTVSVFEPHKVTFYRFNSVNAAMTFNYIIVDGFGRMREEAEVLPGGRWSQRETTYNALGQKLTVSEFGNFAKKTQYAQYDPFGRARRIISPDGLVTQLDYTGVSRLRRTQRIGTTYSAGSVLKTSVSTYEFYDRQGRLSSLQEDTGPGNTPRATNYQYDVNNKLSQVSINYGGEGGSTRSNVALSSNGATAVSSSCADENRFPTLSVIDGNTTGIGWGQGYGGWNDGTANGFPDWVEVRFGGSKTIDEIDIITLQDAFAVENPTGVTEPEPEVTRFTQFGITNFDVQYWNGSAWTTISSRNGNDKVWSRFTLATPVTTDKIRLNVRNAVQSGAGTYSRVVEIQAFERGGAGNTNKQTRQFTYDGRGFLAAEKHPELNAIPLLMPTQDVIYEYDSMGNMTKKRDAVNQHEYFYDQAGRQTEVREYVNGWRKVKEFKFYDNESSPSFSKLRKAIRHNYVNNLYSRERPYPTVDVRISEEYTYNGRSGRLSQRETLLNDPPEDEVGNPNRFIQTFEYDELGNLLSQTYPACANSTCTQSNAQKQRTMTYSYENGYLRGIVGNESGTRTTYASSIDYHINRMVSSVTHGNQVTDLYEMDLNHMARPRSVKARKSNGVMLFDSGIYEYDGVGNVVKIGTDWYTYDHANRISEATARSTEGAAPAGQKRKQRYDYDPLGNLERILTYDNVGDTGPGGDDNDTIDLLVNPQTNRLNGLLYDDAGNIQLGTPTSPTYQYDSFNMMKFRPHMTYLYGPSDERMWIVDHSALDSNGEVILSQIVNTFTLRGLNNEVLREYQLIGDNEVGHWTWVKDYVYRGKSLLAGESVGRGRINFHVDHLGSPRVITNLSGNIIEAHQYFPFGREGTVATASDERLKFTGHERDTQYYESNQLDYMHARNYASMQGRFLSVDSSSNYNPSSSQSWNRYSYALNNPMKFVDPNGKDAMLVVRDNSGGWNAGHAAVRVFGKGYDATYDWGAYLHSVGILGEGTLRVWSDFGSFLRGQSSSGKLKGIVFQTTEAQDKAIMDFYALVIKHSKEQTSEKGKKEGFRIYKHNTTSYIISGINCVTVSIAALEYAEKVTGEEIEGLDELRHRIAPLKIYDNAEEWFDNSEDDMKGVAVWHLDPWATWWGAVP